MIEKPLYPEIEIPFNSLADCVLQSLEAYEVGGSENLTPQQRLFLRHGRTFLENVAQGAALVFGSEANFAEQASKPMPIPDFRELNLPINHPELVQKRALSLAAGAWLGKRNLKTPETVAELQEVCRNYATCLEGIQKGKTA